MKLIASLVVLVSLAGTARSAEFVVVNLIPVPAVVVPAAEPIAFAAAPCPGGVCAVPGTATATVSSSRTTLRARVRTGWRLGDFARRVLSPQ